MSSTAARRTDSRGVSPVVGVVLLTVITVALVAALAASVGAWSLESPPPNAAFDLEVDADRNTVNLDHVAGEPIDVTELTVHVEVDGEALSDQPPVPFVGATGFDGAPEGPFNAEAEPRWEPGERAEFRVAETNEPSLEAGDEVVVTLSIDGHPIARLSTTAA